jgi:hypothetical protein
MVLRGTKFNKKADVPWVDKKLGKHRDPPTDVLILYSHRGFSKSAIREAEYYDKPTVAMQTLDESDAERLFGGASSLWAKYGELGRHEGNTYTSRDSGSTCGKFCSVSRQRN